MDISSIHLVAKTTWACC